MATTEGASGATSDDPHSWRNRLSGLVDDVGNSSPDGEFLVFAHFDGLECGILGFEEDLPIPLSESFHRELPVNHRHDDLPVSWGD